MPVGKQQPDLRVKQLDSSVFVDAFKEFGGPWKEAAAAIREKGQFLATYSLSSQAKRVTNGRILLVGNAAHGYGPMWTRGQDVAIGMEDAYFLSQYLSLRSS